MPEVASLDVVHHMIELCGIFFDDSQHTSCCLGVSQYSPKATSYLSDLSHGKCLIGKIQELSPEASKKIIKDSKVRGSFFFLFFVFFSFIYYTYLVSY